MATYSSKTQVDSIRTQLLTYTAKITDALLLAEATDALNRHLDARMKLININASSASNYSTGVGTSVTKVSIDSAKRSVDETWGEFCDICDAAGVTVPNYKRQGWVWDLRGSV